MPPDLTSLEYAPIAPSRNLGPKLRRIFRWLAALSLLAAAAIWGPAVVMQMWFLHGQRLCLNFSLPSGTVVYANDPHDAKPLLDSGYTPVANVIGQAFGPGMLTTGPAAPSAGYTMPPLGMVDEDRIGSYATFAGALRKIEIANAPLRTGAFLHGLHNPNSPDCLVAILFIERQNPVSFPPADDNRHLEIDALVWRTAGWQPEERLTPLSLTTLPLSRLDKHQVRVFAAQLDPKDASHLIVAYDIDRKPGIIDGWLNPSDHVQLQIRNSPALAQTPAPAVLH